MQLGSTLLAVASLVAPASGFALAGAAPASRTIRAAPATMGLFDGFKKAFENKDYSNSPGQCAPQPP
jgi:hypothetical protein